MPLREDILTPIAGENPSGIDLRYDTHLLIHDKIKEARSWLPCADGRGALLHCLPVDS